MKIEEHFTMRMFLFPPTSCEGDVFSRVCLPTCPQGSYCERVPALFEHVETVGKREVGILVHKMILYSVATKIKMFE